MSDEVQQKKQIIAAHRQRLHLLEVRAAQHGSTIDPAILLEISDIKTIITQLTQDLERAEKKAAQLSVSNPRDFLAQLLQQHTFIEKQVTRSYKPPRDGFEWVKIPAGEFIMGSDRDKDPDTRDIETPQHSVYLDDFWISRFPITNLQYKQFVDDTGYVTPRHWEGGELPKIKELHPVVFVSWRDAQLFCEWANVRLPTEAEWEKAARGADGRLYPWGDTTPHRGLCNFSSTDGTTPVGIFRQGVSPYNVFDMSGNIWELTSSLWGQYRDHSDFPYPYNPNDGRENLNASDNFARIIRGGAFRYYKQVIRCAVRKYFHPLSIDDDVGFRVVRSS